MNYPVDKHTGYRRLIMWSCGEKTHEVAILHSLIKVIFLTETPLQTGGVRMECIKIPKYFLLESLIYVLI